MNEKTVQESGIKEGDFLVLMISSTISATKPKTSEIKITNSSASASASATTEGTSVVTSNAPNENATNTTNASTTGSNEEAINSICEMGFPRDEVIRALRASFNNPDRAVEYLTNGIPEGADVIGEDTPEVSGSRPGLGESNVISGIPSGIVTDNGNENENALSFLLQSPQFIQLRLVVQQNPRLLAPLLEQIAQSNPEVFELIKDNQEAFMNLIQTPLSDSDLQALTQAGALDGEQGEGLEGNLSDEEAGDEDPTNTIQVTEEENVSIERLMALGFDRSRVVQAYFACDKNETIAANFLFEHMNDEDF